MINKREHHFASTWGKPYLDRPSGVFSPFCMAEFAKAVSGFKERYPNGMYYIFGPSELKLLWSLKDGSRLERLFKGGANRLSMLGEISTNGIRQLAGVNIVYRVLLISKGHTEKCSYWFCLEDSHD